MGMNARHDYGHAFRMMNARYHGNPSGVKIASPVLGDSSGVNIPSPVLGDSSVSINPPACNHQTKRPVVDYEYLRQQITISQVLQHLGLQEQLILPRFALHMVNRVLVLHIGIEAKNHVAYLTNPT